MTDARFRPHERINSPLDFRRAFDRKKSASDASMIIYVVENGLPYPRLGISVGKKRIRKATARNHAKRILREAFRLSKPELPTGVDLIIVPRGQTLRFSETLAALPRLARSAAARLGVRPTETRSR
jgi:ribonuclease P protein component